MATLFEIRDTVIDVLKDASIDDYVIDKRINQGYRFCAKRILLPGLETSGTVTTATDAKEVAVPTAWNYGRNLYGAAVLDKPDIKVLNSTALLRKVYPQFDLEIVNGDVEFIVLRGSNIIYYPVPAAATDIVCNFYAAPTEMTDEDDTPSALPLADQEDLLANYALWKIWSQIEDGVEGVKVNTNYYKGEFFEVYNTLDEDTPEGQSQPDPQRGSQWI